MIKTEYKGAYSDILYNYLDKLPVALPDKSTDSIGWYKWYEKLRNCSI